MDEYTLGKTLIENNVTYPKKIYLDMQLLKDYFLGNVLDMIDTEEEYDYILSRLKSYIVRYVDDVEYIFPKLNITNTRFNNNLNKINHNKLFQISPGTTFLKEFIDFMASVNNKAAVKKDRSIPEVVINTYPLKLHPKITNTIAKEFSNAFASHIKIISLPLINMDVDEFKTHEALFVYDFKTLVENPIYKKHFADLEFDETWIYAPKQVRDLDTLNSYETVLSLEEDFIITEHYLKLMCIFEYLNTIGVLIADPKKNP